jgi:hypothetical protein
MITSSSIWEQSVSLEDFTWSVVGISRSSERKHLSLEDNELQEVTAVVESQGDDVNGNEEADDPIVPEEIQRRNHRRKRRLRPPRGHNILPTPIFLLSLPKSGTTSIHKFFTCGLGDPQASANHWIENATGHKKRFGQCMYENVQNNRNIVEGCGDYKVFTDIGTVWTRGSNISRMDSKCYYPSIHGLEAIYNHYPNSTIMLVHRNSTAWAKSVFTWNNLAGRLGDCPGFPVTPYRQRRQTYDHLQEWIDFYDQHTESIRQFAKTHPSLTYVEAALEQDETASYLQSQTGIDADCWRKCKPESGCLEMDQNGNELPTKKLKRKVRNDLNFAPFMPGGPLYQKSTAALLKVSTPILVLSLPQSKVFRVCAWFVCAIVPVLTVTFIF